METLLSHFGFIGQGVITTLQLMLGGMLISIPFAMLIAYIRYNSNCIVKFVVERFISIIRGTPMILQLSFVYFAMPTIIGFPIDIISSGIITFGINSSAYVAEVLRAGIESIPKGQFEAARTLKVPTKNMWIDIIMPQVARNIMPAMVNEMITLLKETALIATLGGMDIMRRSQAVAAEQFDYFTPLCIAGFYYYILILIIEYVAKKLEKRFDYHAENK